MKLTGKEARKVVWHETKDWKEVKGTQETIDNTRWSVIKQAVFEHLSTGKFYLFVWSQGATECQAENPYEYENEVIVNEVVEKEVTKKEWVEI